MPRGSPNVQVIIVPTLQNVMSDMPPALHSHRLEPLFGVQTRVLESEYTLSRLLLSKSIFPPNKVRGARAKVSG